jgi:hypothetical protein
MASAGWALQQAIFAALTADAGLVALLGGQRVWDDVPTRAEFPYVTFAQTSERDWSTGSEEGGEHAFTLHVWSRGGGRKETVEIMGRLRALLHDAPLALAGFRLINLRHEFSEARRDPDGETWHGTLRLRAVTEPEA